MKISFLMLLFGLVSLSVYDVSIKNNLLKTTESFSKKYQSVDQSVKQPSGKAEYVKYCLTCHQSNGSGVPGMYPPLGPGSWVGKEPKDLIKILMEGLQGEIEVNDEVYKNNMPSQSTLTDYEMADILTYIRTNFGNNFKSVSPEIVKSLRANQLK